MLVTILWEIILLKKLIEYCVDVDYVQRINKPTSIFVTLNEKPIAIDRQLLDCDLFVPDNKSDYLFITTEINKNVVDSDIFSFYNKVFFRYWTKIKYYC